MPLLASDEAGASEIAQQALDSFPDLFLQEYFAVMRAKLGLATSHPDDEALVQEFLDLLERSRCDFTLAFRRLGELAGGAATLQPLFDFPESFTPWLARWRERCAQEPSGDARRHEQMLATNPALIPRNHLVEEAIAAAYDNDFSLFHRLTERLTRPFDYTSGDEYLATPPKPEQVVQQTFCGT